MSLSSLIVQSGFATIREIEEALARQVLYGGDLITNLLEVAKVDEGKITTLLAESFALPPAPLGILPHPSAHALSLVPSDLAIRHAMVPLTADEDAITIAVAEPLSQAIEDELSFALGLAVFQRIAPSFRVRQAISRDYQIPLERRLSRLLARIDGEASTATSNSSPPLLQSIPKVAEPPKAPPLAGGTTPHAAAGRSTNMGFPAVRVPTAIPPAPILAGATDRAPAPEMEPVSVRLQNLDPLPRPPLEVATSTPMPAPAQMLQAIATARGSSPPAPQAPPVDAPAPVSVRGDGTTFLQKTATRVRPARRRRGPLVTDVATKELENADDRDAVLDLFFDYARQYFEYSALFIVQTDVAEGRDAYGDGTSRDRVVGITVPLDLPSVLATARERRAPVFVVPARDGADAILMRDLGRAPTVTIAIVPVVVRTRVVALLVGDGGVEIDPASTKDVVRFALDVGRAFERLIARKKAGGRAAPIDREEAPASKRPAANAPAEPPTRREGGPFALASDLREPRDSGAIVASPVLAISSPNEPMPESRRFRTEPPRRKIETVPPPPTAAAVRRPSGRPLPREEDGEGPAHRVDSVRPAAMPTPDNRHVHRVHRDEPKVIVEPDPGSQAVSYPPRRPPPSHADGLNPLPSVMVDVDVEFGELVQRFIESEDEAAESELLRTGLRTMPAIMARFPGPITIQEERLAAIDEDGTTEEEAPPRASECGPVLRLIAGQRRVALPFVLEHVNDEDPERRFWATYLLAELAYPEAAQALLPRLFDDSLRTRRVARMAARTVAEVSPTLLVETLARIATSPDDPANRVYGSAWSARDRRIAAIETLGDLRVASAVPLLIAMLEDPQGSAVAAAHRALTQVTLNDLGEEPKKWNNWWAVNQSRHRIEWLIDALMRDSAETRRIAGEELKVITKEYFGYYDDLPKRERERAQQRYRDWWSTEGRLRFPRN